MTQFFNIIPRWIADGKAKSTETLLERLHREGLLSTDVNMKLNDELPERQLLVEVLLRALHDLTSPEKAIRDDAIQWILHDGDHERSFLWYTDILTYEPEVILYFRSKAKNAMAQTY